MLGIIYVVTFSSKCLSPFHKIRPVVTRWCTWCNAPPIIPVIIGRWCSAPPKILMLLLKNGAKLNQTLRKRSVFCKKCTTNKNSITTGLIEGKPSAEIQIVHIHYTIHYIQCVPARGGTICRRAGFRLPCFFTLYF